MHRTRPSPLVALAGIVVTGVLAWHSHRLAAAQDQGPTARPFSVTAQRYRFDPMRIEVSQGDVVKIELSTADVAHSMTIDAYRISKRATPGQPVTFEFRADQAGTFPFYCDLKSEDGCRRMRGELIVKPR